MTGALASRLVPSAYAPPLDDAARRNVQGGVRDRPTSLLQLQPPSIYYVDSAAEDRCVEAPQVAAINDDGAGE